MDKPRGEKRVASWQNIPFWQWKTFQTHLTLCDHHGLDCNEVCKFTVNRKRRKQGGPDAADVGNKTPSGGPFCMKCQVSLESVVRVLRSIWQNVKNFEVCDMGQNKVLFQFEDENDLDIVLLLSP